MLSIIHKDFKTKTRDPKIQRLYITGRDLFLVIFLSSFLRAISSEYLFEKAPSSEYLRERYLENISESEYLFSDSEIPRAPSSGYDFEKAPSSEYFFEKSPSSENLRERRLANIS